MNNCCMYWIKTACPWHLGLTMFYCTCINMNLYDISFQRDIYGTKKTYSVFSETAPGDTPPSSPLSHLDQGQGSSWWCPVGSVPGDPAASWTVASAPCSEWWSVKKTRFQLTKLTCREPNSNGAKWFEISASTGRISNWEFKKLKNGTSKKKLIIISLQ